MQRFTDLEAWQQAHALVLAIYPFTARFPEERFGPASQLRRPLPVHRRGLSRRDRVPSHPQQRSRLHRDCHPGAALRPDRRPRQDEELIGVTPKRLARTYRFAATVFAINPAEPIDWADLAVGTGYFDQAHFGHEFRAFTGLTPTRYVEVRRRFLREHPGHALDSWPLPTD